jgi:NTP pyrophosphatase (non-canonical NTP hydrolase)
MSYVKIDRGAPETDEVYRWQAEQFGVGIPQNYALVVAEEAGEVCRAVLKREQGIRGTREEWTAKLREELGDLLITMHALAGSEGWDLEEIAAARWRKIQRRDWHADPIGQGVEGEG